MKKQKRYFAIPLIFDKEKYMYLYKNVKVILENEIKELAEAVNKLGEPLSKMGVILD